MECFSSLRDGQRVESSEGQGERGIGWEERREGERKGERGMEGERE